jgi:hypothetical protein
MPQEKPKKKSPSQSAIDSLRSMLGFTAPISVDSTRGPGGAFDYETGQITMGPDSPMWYYAHEGSHARDFEKKGSIEQALAKFRVGASIPRPDGTRGWFYPVEGMERSAEEMAGAYEIMRRINSMEDVDYAVGNLQHLLKTLQDKDADVVGLNRKRLLSNVQELSRHPNNRGSMIRRALLGAGYELR